MDELYTLYKKIMDNSATEEEKKRFSFLKTISCIDPKKLEEILSEKYLQDKKNK